MLSGIGLDIHFEMKKSLKIKYFTLKMRYDYSRGEIVEEDGTVIRELKEIGEELI